MAKYSLLFVYQLLFTYSALPLNVPVCDCNQAKTRGILDINKPYYCQQGTNDTPHKPRISSSYTLVTKQKPIVTWKGWSCQQWVKSKKIIGSFWIGSFDTTFSQETHLVPALECWDMVNNKKCGHNLMQASENTMSFMASPTGKGKWYASRECHVLNCLVEKITLKQNPEEHLIESPFGILNATQQDKQITFNHNTIVWGKITSNFSSTIPLFDGQGYLELTQTDVNNNISRLVDTKRQIEISFYNNPDRLTYVQAAFPVVGMPKTFLIFPTNASECSAPILGRTLFTFLVAITDPHNLPLATSFPSSIYVFPSFHYPRPPSFFYSCKSSFIRGAFIVS